MMSLLQDFARDYQATFIGFGQVFLASGFFVVLAYWLKPRLLPKRPTPIARRARRPKARASQSTAAKVTAGSVDPAYYVAAASMGSSATMPMLRDEHWQRAIEPLRLMIARCERARELHERALVRLDSADYALQRLQLDLADVMTPRPQPVESPAAQPIGDAQDQTTRLAA